jgi:hypothetical protein
MFELENHMAEAIEIALSSDLEDRFLANEISDLAKLQAGVLASDYWCPDDEMSIH